MFLKRCQRQKSGKKHTCWALVESYRTTRGSRQRGVACLGELRPGEQSGWAQLGRTLSGRRRTRPQRSLFDPPGIPERTETEPDAAQKALLSRMGLNLPRRLRPLDSLTDAAQM